MQRILLGFAFVALVLFSSWCSHKTIAQTGALDDLVLRVSRVAANEGALKNRHEAALVWQVTRNQGNTTEKRIEWLKRHSPRVNGTRECKSGNCMWSPYLQRSGALPQGLNIDLDFWTLRVAPIWLDTLRYVEWMARGERTSEDPCHVQPRTWGCEADVRGALARGLFPIGCSRPAGADDGFAYAKDCWRGRWLCDPRFEPSIETEPPSLFDMSIAFSAR